MLAIEKIDHIGIRVHDKKCAIEFYEGLGFELITDVGFEKGHPVIMQHASGVVLNLLGPSDTETAKNILMDVEAKHPGITHVSFKVTSMDDAKAFLKDRNIPLTGEFSFKGMHAIFIRDPDRNVIELDAYAGEEPETRRENDGDDGEGYNAHG